MGGDRRWKAKGKGGAPARFVNHHGRNCPTGKITYPTRADAKTAIRLLQGRGPDPTGRTGHLNVYRCQTCDGLHVGHFDAAAQARREKRTG